MTCAQFCYLVCGLLGPGKLPSSAKKAVAFSLPEHMLFVGGVLLCNL